MNVLYYWPTVVWFFGILEFLIQVYWIGPTKQTSGFSFFISIFLAGFCIWKNCTPLKIKFNEVIKDIQFSPTLFKILLVLVSSIFFIAAWQAHFPPHLMQEFDALNYHMAMPRQHLLAGSLRHIPWSATDLHPLALQWGFAPLWYLNETFNKYPQYLCAVFGFLLMTSLSRKAHSSSYFYFIPALALFTTHGVVIQLGTAMLDLVNLYFLLSFFHATVFKKYFWASLNLGILAAAKAFYPFLIVVSLLAGFIYFFLFNKAALRENFKNASYLFIGAAFICLLLMSRSIYFSMQRAGTPIFPFVTCVFSTAQGCQGKAGEIIRESARQELDVKNHYGTGKDFKSFLNHFWKISIPTIGVNNEYDYPLGLSWLLFSVFLIASFPYWIRSKEIPIIILIALLQWVLWWNMTHQARFLYPVLALGLLGTMSIQKKVHPMILLTALCFSASLSLVSMWRAYKNDLGRSSAQIQKEQKEKLVWDLKTGALITQECLYADQLVTKHAPGYKAVILEDSN